MDERDADGGRDLLHWDVVVVVVIVVVLLLLLFCQIRFRLGASFDPFGAKYFFAFGIKSLGSCPTSLTLRI